MEDRCLKDVAFEVECAKDTPPLNSYHEGYSLIQEEMEELWEEVKGKPPDKSKLYILATIVAARTVRFMQLVYERLEHGDKEVKIEKKGGVVTIKDTR
jgi:hypothetical protein